MQREVLTLDILQKIMKRTKCVTNLKFMCVIIKCIMWIQECNNNVKKRLGLATPAQDFKCVG